MDEQPPASKRAHTEQAPAAAVAPADRAARPRILDVGASYNPLGKYPDELDVLAIDLAPASPDVVKADFLQAEFSDSADSLTAAKLVSHDPGATPGSITLPQRHFDAVVFNLLLSYMPTPEQRFRSVLFQRRRIIAVIFTRRDLQWLFLL